MTPRALAELHAAAISLPPPWSEAAFATQLAQPGSFVTGDSRGFALGRVILDEGELLTLVVAPAERRAGLGAQLMQQALACFEQRGARRIFLEVAADNQAALALYARAGLAATGRRRGYYRPAGAPPVDAITMEKRL